MAETTKSLSPSEAAQLFQHGRELARYCEAQNLSPFHARATVAFTAATMCFRDMSEEEFISVMRTGFKYVCRLSEQAENQDGGREAD